MHVPLLLLELSLALQPPPHSLSNTDAAISPLPDLVLLS